MLRCATQHKHVDPGSLHLFGWALILNSRTNCFSSPHFTYQLLLKSSLYLQTASQVFAYVQTASQVFTLRTNCFSSLHFTYKLLLKSSLYVTNFCRAPNPASLSGFRRARGKNSTYGENQRSRGTSIFLMILGSRR